MKKKIDKIVKKIKKKINFIPIKKGVKNTFSRKKKNIYVHING